MTEDEETDAEDHTSDNFELSRRFLIRVVIGLAIAIPVAIESITLVGLLTSDSSDNRGDDDSNGNADNDGAVGAGDKILEETPQEETVGEFFVWIDDPSWRFTFEIEVVNETDAPYRIGFGSLSTEDGDTYTPSRDNESFDFEPRETKTIETEWEIDNEAVPEEFEITASYGTEYSEEVSESIILGKVPVRNT